MLLIGLITYKSGEKVIKASLGAYFEQLAKDVAKKFDRTIHGLVQEVRNWSEFEVMQEVIIDDVDGKIQAFLIELKKKSKHASSIFIYNSKGIVISSSSKVMLGKDLSGSQVFQQVASGNYYVGDVEYNTFVNEWIITVALPIKAHFEKDKVIGVICAFWRAQELLELTQEDFKENKNTPMKLMLLRGDGLLISSPVKTSNFKENLVDADFISAQKGILGESGYLIEKGLSERKDLIGYAHSDGFQDFQGFGWAVLVGQDIDTAYASIRDLRVSILFLIYFVLIGVVLISMNVSKRMTTPLLKIAGVAQQVSEGKFDHRVDYSAKDEMGDLATLFNKMIQELERLIESEKKFAAHSAVAELERKKVSRTKQGL